MLAVLYLAAAALVSAAVSIAGDLLMSTRSVPETRKMRTIGVLLAGLLWPLVIIGVLQILLVAGSFAFGGRSRKEDFELGV